MRLIHNTYGLPLLLLSVFIWPASSFAADYVKDTQGSFRPVITLEAAKVKALKKSAASGEVESFQSEHEDIGRKTYLYEVANEA